MEEIWKTIPKYEGMLEASNLGRIRTLDRYISRKDTGTEYFVKGKILKFNKHRDGYLKVYFSVENKGKGEFVHRLVAMAFILNPENKSQVNHIDCCKTNNNVINLEWCTNKDNQIHARVNGLVPVLTGKEAARFERAVDVFKDGEYLMTLHGNVDMKEKGYDFRLVSACLKGKRNYHRGCTFKINTGETL
jgi:hypothetical protein